MSEVEPLIFKDISLYIWSWIDLLQCLLWYIANGESNNVLIGEEREEMIIIRKKTSVFSSWISWIFTFRIDSESSIALLLF